MTGRTKAWMVVAALFTVVNVLGIGWAVAAKEMPHTAIHVALSIVGALWMLFLLPRRSPLSADAAMLPEDPRIEQLQQSVDAVALEVERIGEAQRFAAKLQQEKQPNRGGQP